jgi:hypothetical protein
VIRQRLRTQTSPFAWLGRVLAGLVAAALVWYGLMVVLLAAKASPATVNSMSGYRSAFDHLATLGPPSELVRGIVAAAGLLVFAVCGYLALRELPRPYLARHDLELRQDERGTVTVEARAIERAAERAGEAREGVGDVRARYETDGLAVEVEGRRARELPAALRDVQGRVARALDRHGLPSLPVNVTLTGFDRTSRRELE